MGDSEKIAFLISPYLLKWSGVRHWSATKESGIVPLYYRLTVLNFNVMINYSIVLRRTDINDENSPKRAYATAQYTEVTDLDRFCKHIADHGCAYDRADVAAIATKIVDCLREQLLAGQKVKLGALGAFSISLQSRGAESAEKFTASNITAVNVVWEPGKEFTNLIVDAEFNPVPTRSIAAAALKAERAGNGVVDVAAIKEEEAKKRAEKNPSNTPEEPSTGDTENPDENEGPDII